MAIQDEKINVDDVGKSSKTSTFQNKFSIDGMALRRRHVKRLARKAIFFILTIGLISLLTSVIVEKRLGKAEVEEIDLDQNGDPKTPPFEAHYEVPPTRRAPRPPFQDRNLARDAGPEEQTDIDIEELKVEDDKPFRLPELKGPRKDWHDRAAMEADQARFGLGEHGLPAHNDPSEKKLEKEMFQKNGFNALLSDHISVNRSLPDVRVEECKTRQYLAKLPNVTIVFIFYNEHFSTLMRSIYSVINRTPAELLHQIVLVDDGSDRESLKKDLDDYVATNWPNLVKVVHNEKRLGLIGARLEGAKAATGQVMVFFDSHIEANYNWLPPLIEPIAINRKIATCPIVDIINHDNFAYTGGHQEGSRGGFDWKFYYKQLPVLPEDKLDKSLPYRNPVMMGGLFAIDREFFWELGGYDDELDIWGGEQYELSFKIWMCHGMLLDVPCSRVAHIFRGPMESRPNPRNYNFVARNHKRVAEVWMDEYKEFVYKRDPQTYDKIDAGDLTRQRAVRERLNCKSFDWYMNEVAPDFLLKFPTIEPPSYALGAIKNVLTNHCLDTLNLPADNPVGLYPCAKNLTHPQHNQFWALTSDRELRLYQRSDCLDVQKSEPNSTVWMWHCHNMGGNQFWYYDRQHQWVIHSQNNHRCLEAFVKHGDKKVFVNECDTNNKRQKWIFGSVNNALLDKFYEGLAQL